MTKHHGAWHVGGRPDLHQTVVPLDTKGPKRLWDHPAGFVIRDRGAVGAVSTNAYCCPVHGRFEARSDADEVACPLTSWSVAGSDHYFPTRDAIEEAFGPVLRRSGVNFAELRLETQTCGASSPWSPSTFNAWQSAGEVKS